MLIFVQFIMFWLHNYNLSQWGIAVRKKQNHDFKCIFVPKNGASLFIARRAVVSDSDQTVTNR